MRLSFRIGGWLCALGGLFDLGAESLGASRGTTFGPAPAVRVRRRHGRGVRAAQRAGVKRRNQARQRATMKKRCA